MPATKAELIRAYNLLVGGIEEEANEDDERASGGVIRAAKGKLVERMSPHIVRLAWQALDGSYDRLSFGDVKNYRVPIQQHPYLTNLPNEVRKYIGSRLEDYFFNAKVDTHVFVDEIFVMGIECKIIHRKCDAKAHSS